MLHCILRLLILLFGFIIHLQLFLLVIINLLLKYIQLTQQNGFPQKCNQPNPPSAKE